MSKSVSERLRRSPLGLKLERRILQKYAKRNFDSIESIAAVIRDSHLFDADAYGAEMYCDKLGFDPAFHYVLSGEGQGYVSELFDAGFYAARYADVAASGTNKLFHYIKWGANQGRYATQAEIARRPTLANTSDRPALLLICHQASRTGCPVLGWNISQLLKSRFFVIAVMLEGGDLMKAFETCADAVIEWPKLDIDRATFFEQLATRYSPPFAVVNSICSKDVVPYLQQQRLPFVTLVQEFSWAPTHQNGSLETLFSGSAAVIFASETIQTASTRFYKIPPERCFLQPQGQSLLPPLTAEEQNSKSALVEHVDIASRGRVGAGSRPFIVAGMGTVESRKGVDIFLSTATSLMTQRPDLNILFVWIGHRFANPWVKAFLDDLEEQINRSGIADRFLMLPPVATLDAVYREIDVLYLSSRIDPMPNVAIDTALAGKPVVCFQNGTGLADVLRHDDDLKELIVPYLDAGTAANLIAKLAENPDHTKALGLRIQDLARKTFVMSEYVDLIEKTGLRAAAH